MMTKKLRAAGFIKNARLRCQNDNSRDLTVILLFTTTEHHLFQVYILSLPSHTVRNLHFLSKNSTFFSRKNVELFWVKTRENAAVLYFLAVDNFDFPRKLSIFLGEKLVKMLWFWVF